MLEKSKSNAVSKDHLVRSFWKILFLEFGGHCRCKKIFKQLCSCFVPGFIKYMRVKRHISERFPNEILLMKGKHKTDNTNQSILYFTVHRCASRYVMGILRKFAEDSGVTHIDLGAYLFRGGKIYIKPKEIYKKSGYFYGPFYHGPFYQFKFDVLFPIPPIPNLGDYKIVLMLRDPRDVLTSYYFHHCHGIYSNPKQQEFIIERSKEALSKTVDEWVLEKAQIFLERYTIYCEKLMNRPNVLFLKYEDMIGDFNIWLYKLREFTSFNVKEDTIKSIVEKASFRVDKEDVKSHKRQVTPGDYKRKLKKETINILNSQYSEILDVLNYKRKRALEID